MQRELVTGFVLHRRPYRDTSALVDLFTREHGRVAVVARGVQSARGAWRGILQPFRPLWLAWTGRGELFTLTQAEAAGPPAVLAGAVALSGLYLNELLIKLVARDDPHPALFERYAQTLLALSGSDAVAQEAVVLRLFERDLLQQIGFGLVLDRETRNGVPVQSDATYQYVPEQGPLSVQSTLGENRGCTVHGSTLLDLARGELTDDRSMRESKRLLRAVLDHHLGHRRVASRQLRRALEELSITWSEHGQ
mgnify:CR=1 FL=1